MTSTSKVCLILGGATIGATAGYFIFEGVTRHKKVKAIKKITEEFFGLKGSMCSLDDLDPEERAIVTDAFRDYEKKLHALNEGVEEQNSRIRLAGEVATTFVPSLLRFFGDIAVSSSGRKNVIIIGG
jgi:hypothetical protein